MNITPRSQYLHGPNSYPSYLNLQSNMASLQMVPDIHNDINLDENQISYQKNDVDNDFIQPISSSKFLQPIQCHHIYPSPHFPSSDPFQNNQGNFNTIGPKTSHAWNEYKFFYKPLNDFQIYDIFCKEISFEQYLKYIDVQSSNKYVFPFQQPVDKKIYQVTCEMIPHLFVVQFLNKNIRNIELNLNEQPYVKFSEQHKINLRLHLEEFLIINLAPNQICKQNYNLSGNFM
ncbi:14147_t:CDS:1 [Funneliformis geosporum]|uniref:14147_t:CDS:1 n=1 Tax=Funneliformis geosporum TaxID=1117311 RepID=A0A9W4SDD2_9GLOM|nr:14147_t:CDS:1 [Funneliformis geosporum]